MLAAGMLQQQFLIDFARNFGLTPLTCDLSMFSY
jgi:hypothetical protein